MHGLDARRCTFKFMGSVGVSCATDVKSVTVFLWNWKGLKGAMEKSPVDLLGSANIILPT